MKRFIQGAACMLALTLLTASVQADLIVSLHAEDNPRTSTGEAQSHSGIATRTVGGVVETRGSIAGTVSVMAGHEAGTSSYNGTDIRTFSGVSQYNNFNRFGGVIGDDGAAAGLIVWDYDLSGYLGGLTVGTGAGETQFSLDLDYTSRGPQTGNWYVSYTGDGLTRDTTDITTQSVGGTASGLANIALATDTSLYKSILSLSDGSGLASVDLTSELASIAAGDGLLRVAYLDSNFRGDILLQGVSGLVATVSAIPEPSSLAGLSLLGSVLFGAFGRRQSDR